MKTCSKCKQTKPFADFHKDRTRKDAYNSQCIEYRKKYKQEYAQREKVAPAHKRCNSCEELKPITAFSLDRSTKNGRKTICRECDGNRNKRARQTNAAVRLQKSIAARAHSC